MRKVAVLDINNKIPTVRLGGVSADSTKFLCGDQTWAVPSGKEVLLALIADQAVTGTTFADCAGLSFPVEANKKYIVEFHLVFSSSATSVGINLGINGPSPSLVSYLYRTSSDVAAEQTRFGNTLDNAQNTTTLSASIALNYAMMNLIFMNNQNTGTVVLRFAAETAAGIITLKSGSVLKYRVIE